ncbi:hypothetical protein XH79_07235 [Bradyrhizobium sp. CCBAU 45389]|nr:hypothetical protein [Bradyrhizobium sp. CCBAU 45389]
MLCEEYRAGNPDGFGYTWFCTTYEAWKGRARPSTRQPHLGGEKVFVDFAGDTIDVIDSLTGEVQPMKLLVAAMGASNYTYAEACASEGLADWIRAHVTCSPFSAGPRRSWSATTSRPVMSENHQRAFGTTCASRPSEKPLT